MSQVQRLTTQHELTTAWAGLTVGQWQEPGAEGVMIRVIPTLPGSTTLGVLGSAACP